MAVLAIYGAATAAGPGVHALVPCGAGSHESSSVPHPHPDSCPIFLHHAQGQAPTPVALLVLPEAAAEQVAPCDAPRATCVRLGEARPRAPPSPAA